MAVLPVKIYGEKVLRKNAEPVSKITPELKKLAEDMLETMYAAPGIGLAAPQVGESIRLMVVDVREGEEPQNPYIFFNPEIVEKKGSYIDEEGCLSFPGIYANVPRFEEIEVSALNENGEEFQIKADGMLARCIQHELDHLNGVLFIDKLSPTDKLLLKSKLKKLKQKA